MDYLTLCCIAKDENAYIAEWAAYHALLGVERLIVYDNDSRIPLAETLAPLADRMRIVVESMPGPARPGNCQPTPTAWTRTVRKRSGSVLSTWTRFCCRTGKRICDSF